MYELTEADTLLRPVAIAAAEYLKSISQAPRIGFTGVMINKLRQEDLSDEIVRRFGFAVPSPGQRTGIMCVAVVRAGQAPPSRPDNCTMEGMGAIYSLVRFRRMQDSAYVGATMLTVRGGRPDESELCMVLAWKDQQWVGVGRKGVTANACGR